MKNIKTIIQDKYYRYQPGEFLPVRVDGKLTNTREFHLYKLRNWRVTYYQLTHTAS